ncbi:MAG: response regulator transcription factor [Rhodospirillaceae bacterium]|nr:response regulator transcription factor [Rhodospirillaceae bacterium]
MSAEPHRVLLVDDDAGLAGMLREFLELHGFAVEVLPDAERALARLEADMPDLLLLDVMLPGMSGFEALKRVRARHDLPVIMLTARGEESERIMGFMGGADDYLPKPFNPLELVVRAKAVLKRARSGAGVPRPEADELHAGAIRIDLRRREVFAGPVSLSVTAAEFRLLEHLVRHAGEVMSRARLTELALQRSSEAYDRSVDTLISKLRRKLADAGVTTPAIRGLRGHGYVLDNPDAAADQRP